ncbi:hypothetical protein DJ568_00195 [Mucilaginibacter hurinus]|uniref:Ricin B lectin domain-containing protein n=1 Tax=Mucilaginibacter hurinus TaxID=2201324 RepID=A0A367GSU6_9SPHI|nr:RICIN domain-containing protein [Mucilaginibacter hurinus]RCH56320.1 hypothetical protein DJ568_00195 [Mucilaginibacter hurinus]
MKTKMMLLSAAALLLAAQACKKNEGSQPIASSAVNSPKKVNGPVSDYAEYKISCVTGGKFIEVNGNPSANQKFQELQTLGQWQATADDEVDGWQRWYTVYVTTVGGIKYYNIRNSFSGKVIQSPNNTSGAQLRQARTPLLGTPDNQLWRITEIGTTGQYNIINKGNGLAIANAGGSTSNGTAIIQESANSDNRQKWVFTIRFPSTYRDDYANRIFERNGTSQGSVAFDQGTSIPLNWSGNAGKVLWVTQDAFDGSVLQSNSQFNCNQFFQYGNSMLLQNNIYDWSSGGANITRNGNKQVVDKQPGLNFAWPSVGVEIGNHVYIHVGEGNAGVSLNSQSIWDFTETTGTAWTGTRLAPANMSNQTNINYVIGMVKSGTDVYSFGAGPSNGVYVARWPQSNPTSWSFWNGSSWVSTPTTATSAKIATGLDNTTISYCNGKYVMMTMTQGYICGTTREIYVSTATSPTGPFSTPIRVYSIKEYINGNYSRYYTPQIHPEHNNGKNELLLSYCLNFDACGQGACNGTYKDPYYYRPKFIRVPYSKIGL